MPTAQEEHKEHVDELIAHPNVLARVRKSVGDVVNDWGFPEQVTEDAQLLVTELLANVVRHVPDKHCTLRLTPIDDGVTIEVADRSTKPPELKAFDPLAESGNGIRLINSLCGREWLWVPTDGGKKIICKLSA